MRDDNAADKEEYREYLRFLGRLSVFDRSYLTTDKFRPQKQENYHAENHDWLIGGSSRRHHEQMIHSFKIVDDRLAKTIDDSKSSRWTGLYLTADRQLHSRFATKERASGKRCSFPRHWAPTDTFSAPKVIP